MIKKRFFLITLLLFLFISTFLSAINTPWLHTDGKFIKDPDGNTVVLRGLSYGSVWVMGEREGPRYSFFPHPEEPDIAKARIKALIDLATDESQGWYSRVLRFPVYPVAEDADPGWSTCTPDQLERYKDLLDTAIQYATEKGVYCIIDWHYIDHYSDKLEKTRDFWDYAADRYKDMSNVMFEIYNEPIAYEPAFVPNEPDYSWARWKDTIAQPIVDRIRNVHNAENLILVGAPRWSQLIKDAAVNPVTGDNLVYVCHIYPYHFENKGEEGYEIGDLSPYVGDTINKYPVFFTEWGFEDGASIPCDADDEDRYAAGMREYLAETGASWTGWCFDPWWQPIMFSTWDYAGLLGTSLPSTGGYQGQFINDLLTENKDNDLPGEGGSNKKPVVNLISPEENAVFDEGDPVLLEATASDSDGSIAKVEFYVGSEKIGEDDTSPFTYNWAAELNSTSIAAKAIDNQGASQTDRVNITVNGSTNIAPTVAVTAPTNGAVFDEGEQITITTLAEDSDGTVTKIEVYVNDTKIGEGASVNWTVGAGTFVIKSKATDNLDASTTSTSVSITGKPVQTGDITAAWEGNIWNSGFSGNITITNKSGQTINGWIVTITFSNGEQMTSSWNTDASQTGDTCTFENISWNGTIQNNQTAGFGFQGTHSGSFEFPTDITVTPK